MCRVPAGAVYCYRVTMISGITCCIVPDGVTGITNSRPIPIISAFVVCHI